MHPTNILCFLPLLPLLDLKARISPSKSSNPLGRVLEIWLQILCSLKWCISRCQTWLMCFELKKGQVNDVGILSESDYMIRTFTGALRLVLTSAIQLCCSGSVAHMLTLIVPVLTVSLHGQWFWLEWGWVTVLGQGSLFSCLHPLPSPTPPLYPSAHPSILFQPFGQLSLNPANHRRGRSVGNQTSPWLCSSPACAIRDCLLKRLLHVGM